MKKFALAGNPNCGKTTLFNSLTGSTAHVGNWPGGTVDKRDGVYKKTPNPVAIVDLPGIYSLSPYTPEEVIARNYILDEKPDCVINIVDATNLERNLYLTTQILEIDVPVVVALNMIDAVEKAGDKIDAKALEEKLGVPVAHLGKTWISKAWKRFSDASAKTGQPVPELIPLSIGETIVSGDDRITALPANHAIDDTEQALIYLIEKGPVRIIYATDTGGIMGVAARIAGIDPHVKPGNPINGLIMEATMGMGDKGDEDFRIFTHSSVNTVHRTTKMLLKRKRLVMKEGQSVYLTHLARTLHGTQAELDATLPAPLKAAYDGLEVVFEA